MVNQDGLQVVAQRLYERYLSDARDPGFRNWEKLDDKEKSYAIKEAEALLSAYLKRAQSLA